MSKTLTPLNVTTNMANNELLTNINKWIQFNVTIQNIGSETTPKFHIELLGPPEAIIAPKKRDIGGLGRGKIKKIPFKVRSKVKGVFSLNVVCKNGKENELVTVPITLKVGAYALNLEPEKVIQIEETIIEEQSEGEEATNLCPFCYAQINTESVFCESCGSKID